MNKIEIDLSTQNFKIFFTSDLHLGHENILKFCNRPFETTEKMFQTIVENWNKKISPNDMVFLVGDIFWKTSPNLITKFFLKTNGRKYFISGNHDSVKSTKSISKYCTILDDVVHLWVTVNQTTFRFVVSHYPLYSYAGIEKHTSLNLHGHVHSGKLCTGFDSNFSSNKHYDVGVDNNNFEPVEITEIIKLKFL